MSEELEWELYDIFESNIFAFPVYEQSAAKRVIRLLLKRGVLEEEIANAIEGTTVDVHVWLNRGGRSMVGEWAIAWINDSREQYMIDRCHQMARRNGSLDSNPDFYSSGDMSPSSECSTPLSGNSSFCDMTSALEDDISGGSDSENGFGFQTNRLARTFDTENKSSIVSLDLNTDLTGRNHKNRLTVCDLTPDVHFLSDRTLDADSGNVSDLCACANCNMSRLRPEVRRELVEMNGCSASSAKLFHAGPLLPECVDCRCTLSHYSHRQRNACYKCSRGNLRESETD